MIRYARNCRWQNLWFFCTTWHLLFPWLWFCRKILANKTKAQTTIITTYKTKQYNKQIINKTANKKIYETSNNNKKNQHTKLTKQHTLDLLLLNLRFYHVFEKRHENMTYKIFNKPLFLNTFYTLYTIVVTCCCSHFSYKAVLWLLPCLKFWLV